jgi:hypothetical protein
MFKPEREIEIFAVRKVTFEKSHTIINLAPVSKQEADNIIEMARVRINEMSRENIFDYYQELGRRFNKLTKELNYFAAELEVADVIYLEDVDKMHALNINRSRLLFEMDFFEFIIDANNKEIVYKNRHNPENLYIYKGKNQKS